MSDSSMTKDQPPATAGRSDRRSYLESDAPQQVDISRIRAQRIKHRINFQFNHAGRVLGVSLFQPVERLICVGKAGVQFGNDDRRNVVSLYLFFCDLEVLTPKAS